MPIATAVPVAAMHRIASAMEARRVAMRVTSPAVASRTTVASRTAAGKVPPSRVMSTAADVTTARTRVADARSVAPAAAMTTAPAVRLRQRGRRSDQ
jgi:hypothetical protein